MAKRADRNGAPDAIMQSAGLGDQLYGRLVSLIEGGEFAQGSRLPAESELAERFNVSRPMIWEALSRLRGDGAIISRKGAGSFVQGPPGHAHERTHLGFGPISSLAQVKQCFDFRVGLEGEAAFWAAQNRTAATVSQLRTALARLEDAITQRIIGKDADYDFHIAVAHASANDFFEVVLTSMRPSIEFAINLSRSLSLTRPLERLRIVQAEHIAIFTAIESGDKEAARNEMRTHLSNACSRVFEGPAGGERRNILSSS